MEYIDIDLYETIEGAVELVMPKAEEKGLELACHIRPDVPRGVVGDPTRLKQIVLNLLNNAVKFTEHGEVTLTIDREQAINNEGGAVQLGFSVRDTGIGIPPERMGRLFRSFSQVDASTTRRYGGTGLGLAISKRLVEQMGGAIKAESEVGKGSTFSFTIPLNTCVLPDRTDRRDRLAGLHGKSVLVVDDNRTNRRIMDEKLRGWGMLPTIHSSPKQVLEAWDRLAGFDAMLIDYKMPGKTGLELFRELKAMSEDALPPVILFTSLTPAEPDFWSELREAGFASIITKPAKSSQLLQAISVAIDPARKDAGEAPVQRSRERDKDLSILLVDDNRINRKVGLKLLGKFGYSADIATGGAEAVSMATEKPFDIILMDIEMPDMDGLEATSHIREALAGGAVPVVVALTANAQTSARQKYLEAGMDDYLSKPIDEEELQACLARVAAERDAQFQGDLKTAENG